MHTDYLILGPFLLNEKEKKSGPKIFFNMIRKNFTLCMAILLKIFSDMPIYHAMPTIELTRN